MKANNQILGFTYGIDVSADGWESHLDLDTDPRTLVSKQSSDKTDIYQPEGKHWHLFDPIGLNWAKKKVQSVERNV